VIANAAQLRHVDGRSRGPSRIPQDSWTPTSSEWPRRFTRSLGRCAASERHPGRHRQRRRLSRLPGGSAYSASKSAAITYLRVCAWSSAARACRGHDLSRLHSTPMTAANRYPMPFIIDATRRPGGSPRAIAAKTPLRGHPLAEWRSFVRASPSAALAVRPVVRQRPRKARGLPL